MHVLTRYTSVVSEPRNHWHVKCINVSAIFSLEGQQGKSVMYHTHKWIG